MKWECKNKAHMKMLESVGKRE